MRFMKYILLVILIYSSIPKVLNYQGKMLDSDGVGITDNLPMTFRVYDVDEGGTLLWSETISNVEISKGLFSVVLGTIDDFDTLSFARQYWLEVEVDGEILFPREQLTSTPYSIHSEYTSNAIQSVHSTLTRIPKTGKLIFGVGDGGSITESADGDTIRISLAGEGGDLDIEVSAPLSGEGTVETPYTVNYDNSTIGMNTSDQLFVKDNGISTSQIFDETIIRGDLSSTLLTDLDDAVTIDGHSASDFAPATSSNSYIQNQMEIDQSANFRIDGDALIGGNIGIGTTDPQLTFDLRAPCSPDAGKGSILLAPSNDDLAKSFVIRLDSVSLDLAIDRQYDHTWNEVFRIKRNNGNIGIGTSNPDNILHLKNDAPVLTAEATNAVSGLRVNVKGTANQILRIQEDGTNRFTIVTGGNVGIGTVSPNGILDIAGGQSNDVGTYSLAFTNTDAAGRWIGFRLTADPDADLAIDRQYGGADYEVMRIKRNNGNIGIGTSNPASALHIDGDLRIQGEMNMNSIIVNRVKKTIGWSQSEITAITGISTFCIVTGIALKNNGSNNYGKIFAEFTVANDGTAYFTTDKTKSADTSGNHWLEWTASTGTLKIKNSAGVTVDYVLEIQYQ